MAFLLTTCAGLATLLGTIFIFIKPKNEYVLINKALSFAAGVMIAVSLIDLIPECFSLIDNKFTTIIILLISINVGIIISMFIDKITSRVEELYRVGIISMIALMLHNIPEGLATYIASTHDIKLGITLAVAIALHNIPEGITISIPIYYATRNKFKAFIYTLIASLSEILGAIIASICFKNGIDNTNMALLLGIISGIMFYIAIYEIIPQSLHYKDYKLTFKWFIIGAIVMALSIWI